MDTHKAIALALIVCFTHALPLHAEAGRSEFERWKQQESTEFKEYRDKRDQEFTLFLKNNWKELQTFQGLVRDVQPKPLAIPVAPNVAPVSTTPAPGKAPVPNRLPVIEAIAPDKSPSAETSQEQGGTTQLNVPAPAVITIPLVTVPVIEAAPKLPKVIPAAVAELPRGKTVELVFYGQPLRFTYDPALKVKMPSRIDGQNISDHWSTLSLADYEPLLKQIEAQRVPLQLNDWGYALLTHELASKIFPGSKNDQALLTWFIMVKAGYKARIAYDISRVYLLMPTQQQIYATAYFTFDNQRYYALGLNGNKDKLDRVFTYDGNYPGASKVLDMRLGKSLNTARKDKFKTVDFSYAGKKYKVKLDTDDETVAYLQTYPQMDINLYFSAEVNRATAHPLLLQLKPLVQGKSEHDAVNLLLRFVQTAFPYNTDEQQFGIENYLFPEETLYYPYSDCEDRSVLFAWLVKNLVSLDVVGLDYPGHVATAVQFNEKISGDSVMHNGKRYVVTDPTYINASVGMAMPEFKNERPKIIVF